VKFGLIMNLQCDSTELLPGTEVVARGLRWEVVSIESLGQETLFRLRGLENAVLGNLRSAHPPLIIPEFPLVRS